MQDNEISLHQIICNKLEHALEEFNNIDDDLFQSVDQNQIKRIKSLIQTASIKINKYHEPLTLLNSEDEHVTLIKQWSNKRMMEVLYDSDTDGIDNRMFCNKVMNRQNICLTVIDNQNNVFGVFTSFPLSINEYNYDQSCFLFTFYDTPHKIHSINTFGVEINDSGNFLFSIHGGFVIGKGKTSYISHSITDQFECESMKIINNNDNIFQIQRIIAMQLK